jgi:hypothetical protein
VFYGRVVTYVNDDELVGSLELVGHLVDAGLGTDIVLARRAGHADRPDHIARRRTSTATPRTPSARTYQRGPHLQRPGSKAVKGGPQVQFRKSKKIRSVGQTGSLLPSPASALRWA